MSNMLSTFEPYAYALMRFITGFLFMWHGTQKLFGYPPSQGGGGGSLSATMAIGGGIELIGGIMIMIGLFAGFAAFISSGTMAVAYFGWHFSMDAFLPIVNRGELAVLYCFVLLFIAARGSGILSVDSLIWPSATTSSEP
ncbi:MAG: DoxX family protein [Blastocatellia bacterium]|nr:DoxX family protein [Blastocatellia bacterium]